jgi:serine/threonine-protein kinase
MPLEPGVRLDAYEIVRPLGSGGMGEVWLATEVRLGRKVALKLLPSDLTREASRVLRFEQEARAASALNHPNVCTIHALGETPDGLRYIVMEYVEGETLRERLSTTRLTIPTALEIAMQVAAALGAAHAAGIVHRDLKPENVMVRPDGLVKVLDFGLAKLAPAGADVASAAATRTGLKTEAGVVVGTATYMSPEQARGQEVDARSDIWSLGVLLYEMVAGRSPFARPTGTDVLAAILERDPAPLSSVSASAPPELQRIASKALRKDRDERYQDIRDLLVDLRALREAPRLSPAAEARAGISRAIGKKLAWLALSIGALVLMAAGVGVWRGRSASPAATIQSLAVLPLDNLSGDEAQEYFADGMTDALITELAQIDDIRVISRASVMQFKNARKPVATIGRELGVDAIVEGSVRRSEKRVAISCQLVHAASDRHLWARSYESDLQDIVSVQREIATAVATEIRRKIAGGERSSRRVDPEAYDECVRGRYFWNQRQEPALKQAIQHFEQALAQDSAYAPAHSGLADSHFYLGYAFGRVPPREAMPRARAAALKAVELDGGLAEGHTSLALVRFIYDWDWAAAEQGFRRAISLNPSYALAHHGYAVLLQTLGRRNEAVDEAKRALAVDPLSIPINSIVGSMLQGAGRHREAIAACQRTLELQPNFGGARGLLAASYRALGLDANALREALEAKRANGSTSEETDGFRQAYEQNGWRGFDELELKLALMRFNGWHLDAFSLAGMSAQVGNKAEALRWLDVAYQARSGGLVWLTSNNRLNALLRDEPRYRALLAAMRLPLPARATTSSDP